MSKIYGFGNALIDIEIQITEEELKEINIEKGLMKHISRDNLEAYLDRFSNQRHSALPGGSIANSLYAANQHNIQTHFTCAIGNDDFGKSFVNSFKSELCSLSFHESDISTGVCLIFITPDGQRTMAANLGANTHIHSDSIDEEKLRTSEYLVFDNFSLSTQSGFNIAKFCMSLNQSLKVCFGISDVSLVEENNTQLSELLDLGIEILYGNEVEVNAISKAHKIDSLNVLTSFGKRGAAFNEIKLKAPEIEIVNSNGAGDALLGTFLANQISNKNIKDSLRDAISYASEVCRTNGPRLE
tara:strand:- start:65 stop:961 length:897 start_codon:yes stop_codon:yes gene_type:complete